MSDATASGGTVTIDELVLADEPERWRALGFEPDGDCVRLGTIRVRLAGEDAHAGSAPGFLGWSLRGAASTELDGLPTSRAASTELDGLPTSRAEAPDRDGMPTSRAASTELDDLPTSRAEAPDGDGSAQPPRHPNGIVAVDHVVAMTPALERTVAALQEAGLDLRRIREQPTPAGAPRQAFFRLGEAIVEVVQEPPELVAQREGGAERPARLWGLALLAPDFERTVDALGELAGEPRDAVQEGRRIVTVRRSVGVSVPLAVLSAPPAR